MLGRLPSAAGTRQHGPECRGGRAAQDRRVLRRCVQLGRRVRGRDRAPPRPAPGRSWPSSGWARTPCSVPSSSLSPGERTRAELAAFARRSASTSSSSTSRRTISTCRPSNSWSRRSHEYGGTLLLVSHDRRLLESVPLTRAGRASRRRPAGTRRAREVCPGVRRTPPQPAGTAIRNPLRRSDHPGPPSCCAVVVQHRARAPEPGKAVQHGGCDMTTQPRGRRADGRGS